MRSLLFTTIIALISFSAAPHARCANVVLNGSLEDLNSTFINVIGDYDTLAAGSVPLLPIGRCPRELRITIVWAKTPTSDGRTAADATYFVDLTGTGARVRPMARSNRL